MKIAVMGGTGLIGSQVVKILNASGHAAVPHSPSTGVDLLSGRGLSEALKGADVVVDLINSPTFDDRNVSSRVVVQDGQTVGLAGLIRDNATLGNQGIPWLKDVPLLGLLAGSQNNTRQRSELLILITPHVMHDQRDARALTEDLRDQLINAAAVPDRLNSLRPSGSPDPGARLRSKLQLQP